MEREGAPNVIAEHRPRVGVGLLDGRARVADERRIREGITQVAGEAVGHLAFLIHPPVWDELGVMTYFELFLPRRIRF